jgi:hypothetical protein
MLEEDIVTCSYLVGLAVCSVKNETGSMSNKVLVRTDNVAADRIVSTFYFQTKMINKSYITTRFLS